MKRKRKDPMTNLNLPSGQREALADLLATKDVDVLREMLQLVYRAAIEAQFDEQVGADRYERTDDRHDLRNGSRRRDLNTRVGDSSRRASSASGAVSAHSLP